MAIVRVKHDDNYTCIDNSIGRDRNLSFKAKGILLYMLGCKDDWNFTIQGICALSSDGYNAVRTGLIELEEKGYLKRSFIREGGRIVDVEYTVYEQSQGVNFHTNKGNTIL